MTYARTPKDFEALQERYLAEAVATASPATRVVMLFDKLVADCVQAAAAFDERDWYRVNEALVNAQEILIYLSASLDVDKWPEAGEQLRSLYNFLYAELVEANLKKDRDRLERTRPMIVRLADAWRQAATKVNGDEVGQVQASAQAGSLEAGALVQEVARGVA